VVVLVVYSLLAGPITEAFQPAGCPDCVQGAGFGYLVIWLAVATVTVAACIARARHHRPRRESPAAPPTWTVRGRDRETPDVKPSQDVPQARSGTSSGRLSTP
jgi:hypothetical protein